MIQGPVVTIEYDGNSVRGDRVRAWLMTDELHNLHEIHPPQLVRAVMQEDIQMLARVDWVDRPTSTGCLLQLTLLEPWQRGGGNWLFPHDPSQRWEQEHGATG